MGRALVGLKPKCWKVVVFPDVTETSMPSEHPFLNMACWICVLLFLPVFRSRLKTPDLKYGAGNEDEPFFFNELRLHTKAIVGAARQAHSRL